MRKELMVSTSQHSHTHTLSTPGLPLSILGLRFSCLNSTIYHPTQQWFRWIHYRLGAWAGGGQWSLVNGWSCGFTVNRSATGTSCFPHDGHHRGIGDQDSCQTRSKRPPPQAPGRPRKDPEGLGFPETLWTQMTYCSRDKVGQPANEQATGDSKQIKEKKNGPPL